MTPGLIAKMFLPLAMPGLAAMGMGLLSVASSSYNLVEVISIVLGLLVVAVAGVFTIRSNVAKIWREQAEGEKARVNDLTAQLAEIRIEHAAELAEKKIDTAKCLAELHKTQEELAAANLRTDLTAVLKQMAEEHGEVITALLSINKSLTKGLNGGS